MFLDESAAALLEFKNGRKLIQEEINIKEEVMDDDNDSNMDIDGDVPRLGPATFGTVTYFTFAVIIVLFVVDNDSITSC